MAFPMRNPAWDRIDWKRLALACVAMERMAAGAVYATSLKTHCFGDGAQSITDDDLRAAATRVGLDPNALLAGIDAVETRNCHDVIPVALSLTDPNLRCHPGLDPGSRVSSAQRARCSWMPGQARHDDCGWPYERVTHRGNGYESARCNSRRGLRRADVRSGNWGTVLGAGSAADPAAPFARARPSKVKTPGTRPGVFRITWTVVISASSTARIRV